MLIRSRLENDLKQLKPYWSKLRIYKDGSADYKWRAVMPRARFVDFLCNKAWEIDYDSHFKEVAQARSPGGAAEGAKRHSAYMSAWSAFCQMQDTAPYGGYGTGYGYGSGYGYGGGYGSTYKGNSNSGVKSNNPATTESYCDVNYIVVGPTGENGKRERAQLWCTKRRPHTGQHDMTDRHVIGDSDNYHNLPHKQADRVAAGQKPKWYTPPKPVEVTKSGNPPAQILPNQTASSQIASNVTAYAGAPSTVDSMCKALMTNKLENIIIDENTPYPTADLYIEATHWKFVGPLDAISVLDILNELMMEVTTPQKAYDEYRDTLEKLVKGQLGNEKMDLTDEDYHSYPCLQEVNNEDSNTN